MYEVIWAFAIVQIAALGLLVDKVTGGEIGIMIMIWVLIIQRRKK